MYICYEFAQSHRFVRERVANERLEISFIYTHDQVADGFTKALRGVQTQSKPQEGSD